MKKKYFNGICHLISVCIVAVININLTGCATLDYTKLPDETDYNDPKVNPSKNTGIKLISSYQSQVNRKCKVHRDTLVAMAISGGGHRAANFAAGVMSELENYEVLKEIDYISTVSGGGFAASIYMASLIDHINDKGLNKGSNENYSFNEYIYPGTLNKNSLLKDLERDYTWSLIFGFLNPLNWFPPKDRGDLLETSIDKHVLGRKWRGRSLLISDVFKYEDKSENPDFSKMVPYWVTNATIYNDGAHFPFAPEVLKKYGVFQYTHRSWREDIAGDNVSVMPLAVGVKASASFPIGVPPSTLRCKLDINKSTYDDLFLHLMDGGCSDNLGVDTAIRMLDEGAVKEKKKRLKKVLLVIDAFKGSSFPYSGREREPNEGSEMIKTMNIGLDSKHVNIKHDLEADKNIDVIFFDFECIDENDLTKIYDDLVSKGEIDKNDKDAKKIIMAGPKHVSTAFNVSKTEQLLLLESGKTAVRKTIIKESSASKKRKNSFLDIVKRK